MYKYDELNYELNKNIPEICKEGKELRLRYRNSEIPCHVYFSETLNKLLFQLLKSEYSNNELLKKIFLFIEEMANSDDNEVKYLVQVTILESLWDNAYILDKAEKMMGIETKKLNLEVSKYLDRPNF